MPGASAWEAASGYLNGSAWLLLLTSFYVGICIEFLKYIRHFLQRFWICDIEHNNTVACGRCLRSVMVSVCKQDPLVGKQHASLVMPRHYFRNQLQRGPVVLLASGFFWTVICRPKFWLVVLFRLSVSPRKLCFALIQVYLPSDMFPTSSRLGDSYPFSNFRALVFLVHWRLVDL